MVNVEIDLLCEKELKIQIALGTLSYNIPQLRHLIKTTSDLGIISWATRHTEIIIRRDAVLLHKISIEDFTRLVLFETSGRVLKALKLEWSSNRGYFISSKHSRYEEFIKYFTNAGINFD